VSQRGQGLAEYSLIVALVVVIVIVILLTLGHSVINLFSNFTAAFLGAH
jgi:Flp pilus assembly pilin Flp